MPRWASAKCTLGETKGWRVTDGIFLADLCEVFLVALAAICLLGQAA